jgi:hypothetical protein
MANRAYFYAYRDDAEELLFLSESWHPIPFWFKVALSTGAEMIPSQIFEGDEPVAIQAPFKAGLERLFEFGAYLQSQSVPDADLLQDFLDRTRHYFGPEQVNNHHFLLEAAEIYDLIPEETPEDQNEQLLFEIQRMGVEMAKILADKPGDLRKAVASPWVKYLWNNWEEAMDVRWLIDEEG